MEKLKLSAYNKAKAAGDKILVELYEVEKEEKTTDSGLVLPGSANKKIYENPEEIGVVVDLGPLYKGDLQIGDHIITGSFTGTPVGVGEKKYLSLDSDKVYIKLYK